MYSPLKSIIKHNKYFQRGVKFPLKFPKTNTLAGSLIERASSMLDEIASKTMHKDEEGDQ